MRSTHSHAKSDDAPFQKVICNIEIVCEHWANFKGGRDDNNKLQTIVALL